jgi:tocopherol O-methyltransferase
LIEGLPPSTRPEVVAYYNETWLDFRVLWMTLRNPAIHFGYWDESTATHGQSLENMNRVMADVGHVRPGQRILDAGCGVGGGAFWLARNRNALVHCITIVESQALRGRRFARSRGLQGQVSFTCQDFCQTAFPDETFDLVWARESVCHATDKQAFFAEAHRLLRPGGRLVMADFARVTRSLPVEDEGVMATWLRGWAIPDVTTPAELIQASVSAGFDGVAVRDVTAAVEPSLRRLYRIVRVLSPGAGVLYRLRIRSRVQQGNVEGSAAMWHALRRDLWAYVILTAQKP